ncbi:Hydroxyproline O-arabinosyltransferase 3 [Castilleja foliolosa]|uniref:Hydroxyproline O-arabinosyltransferase 3 n=1 Tax=Castilleja foliolosa TaxID=1961234 RepID=A0ABD3B7Y3_9LAMI
MIVRKNVGRASPFLLVLLAFGFFIGTYNLCILVMHKSGRSISDDSNDPIISRPDGLSVEGSRKFHVALTATDAPYSKWQCRIMYYWYKKMKEMPGSDMGGFTRVLHSGSPDNLMDEIPTMIVDPLPDGLDRGYIVLNRPWAFVQWLEKAVIEEEYILMAEPYHHEKILS